MMKKDESFTFEEAIGPVPAYRHENGGGWVANTARVDPTVYVGPDAMVYNRATVLGNSKISGSARVYGRSTVCKEAVITDSARVYDHAFVTDRAQIKGESHVYGSSYICHDVLIHDAARVSDSVCVYGRATVYGELGGEVRVYGATHICKGFRLSGDVILRRGTFKEIPPMIMRSDGHAFVLMPDDTITAGCRDFTKEQALRHWGNPEHPHRAESLFILDRLFAMRDFRKAQFTASMKETEND